MKTTINHLKLKLIVILYSLIILQTNAQTSIKGKVVSELNESLIGTSALLLDAKDSSLISATFTDVEGNFNFEKLSESQYLLSLTNVGYLNDLLPVVPVDNRVEYTLKPATNILNQVTVKAKKPFIEQKIDRLVINVKNSITNAGGTVLDILQKSPGVQVNKQAGTLSMIGKDGVQVMINGKISYIPASALINMLEGMSSNNVDRIELITTPPAKYDAGGNAGYINIVLNQKPDEGLNGSYSLTAAGFNGSAPAANFDLNFRKNKLSVYGGYSFSRRAQMQYISNNRSTEFESVKTQTNIYSVRDPFQLNNGLRMGMDYQIAKRTSIGVLISGYRNEWDMKANNISSVLKNGTEVTHINIANNETNLWKHGMLNANIQHEFVNGAQLNFNIDYLKYDNFNPTDYSNVYTDMGQFLREDNLASSKKTLINMLPVSLDFSKKVNDKLSIESGLKTVISRFSNDVLVQNEIAGNWVSDDEFTANYKLKENIAAAYGSANYTLNAKNSLKAGLRYEYTVSNLGSEKQANIVDRKYGYLFPTAYWSHKINDDYSLNFNYNKRINRPAFNDLAPFLIFVDPNTFISGNAALQPALANNLSAGLSLKMINVSLNYSHEKYSIGGFQLKINSETNRQYNTAENLKFTESLFVTVSVPTKISKWWNGQLNFNASANHAVADFVQPAVSVKIMNFSLSGFQGFTISPKVSMELSGFYQSKGLYGIAVMKAFGQLNYGVVYKFPKADANLKFGVDDIFSTMKFNFEQNSKIQGYEAFMNLNMQRRIFKLTYSKNFGNKEVKAKRNRSTASETERQRVK